MRLWMLKRKKLKGNIFSLLSTVVRVAWDFFFHFPFFLANISLLLAAFFSSMRVRRQQREKSSGEGKGKGKKTKQSSCKIWTFGGADRCEWSVLWLFFSFFFFSFASNSNNSTFTPFLYSMLVDGACSHFTTFFARFSLSILIFSRIFFFSFFHHPLKHPLSPAISLYPSLWLHSTSWLASSWCLGRAWARLASHPSLDAIRWHSLAWSLFSLLNN